MAGPDCSYRTYRAALRPRSARQGNADALHKALAEVDQENARETEHRSFDAKKLADGRRTRSTP